MQISLLTLKSFIFNMFILLPTYYKTYFIMDGEKLEARSSESKRKTTVKKYIFQLINEPNSLNDK